MLLQPCEKPTIMATELVSVSHSPIHLRASVLLAERSGPRLGCKNAILEEAIKDGIFESLDMGHYIDQYGDRAIDVMESVTDKLFEKLTPDQKAKKDAYLKRNQGGRIHGDDSYHSTNRGRKTRDQRGDNDNTKGSDGSKMDDIDKAAKSNSEDELKKKMRNASGKGDHKKARKYNRALRMKKSGKEGTSGRHGAGDANQA